MTMKYLVQQRGLPANRLAVRIPLYGRGFAVSTPYASTKDAPDIRIPRGDHNNLLRLQQEVCSYDAGESFGVFEPSGRWHGILPAFRDALNSYQSLAATVGVMAEQSPLRPRIRIC